MQRLVRLFLPSPLQRQAKGQCEQFLRPGKLFRAKQADLHMRPSFKNRFY